MEEDNEDNEAAPPDAARQQAEQLTLALALTLTLTLTQVVSARAIKHVRELTAIASGERTEPVHPNPSPNPIPSPNPNPQTLTPTPEP